MKTDTPGEKAREFWNEQARRFEDNWPMIAELMRDRGQSAWLASECDRLNALLSERENIVSAGGAYELKLYGTPGYIGTIAGITCHADPDVPEHTVIVKDEHGRELARIINVGK